jgi:hypothetical protein
VTASAVPNPDISWVIFIAVGFSPAPIAIEDYTNVMRCLCEIKITNYAPFIKWIEE